MYGLRESSIDNNGEMYIILKFRCSSVVYYTKERSHCFLSKIQQGFVP